MGTVSFHQISKTVQQSSTFGSIQSAPWGTKTESIGGSLDGEVNIGLVSFLDLSDDFPSGWVDSGECLSTNGLVEFVVVEDLKHKVVNGEKSKLCL